MDHFDIFYKLALPLRMPVVPGPRPIPRVPPPAAPVRTFPPNTPNMPPVPQLSSQPLPVSKHRLFEGPARPPAKPMPVPEVPGKIPALEPVPGKAPRWPAAPKEWAEVDAARAHLPKKLPVVPELPAPKYEPVTIGRGGKPKIPESYLRDKVPEAAVKSEIAAAMRRAADAKRYVRKEQMAALNSYLNQAMLVAKTRPMAYQLGLATPTALEGMLAISTVSMLYLLLTGKKPETNRPQVAQVVETVTGGVQTPMPIAQQMQTALQGANTALSSAMTDPKIEVENQAALQSYVALLNDLGKDLNTIASAKLTLNSSAEASSYVGQLSKAEASLADKMRLLEQLKGFFAAKQMGQQMVAIDKLMVSIGNFLAAVASSRGAA